MTDPNKTFVTNEQALASTRAFTVILLLIALVLAYWIWPSEITGLAIASIKFGSLLRAIVSGLIVLISCYVAFFLWIE